MIQPPSRQYDVIGIGVSAVDDTLTIEKYPQPNVKVPVLGSTRHGGGLACTAERSESGRSAAEDGARRLFCLAMQSAPFWGAAENSRLEPLRGRTACRLIAL